MPEINLDALINAFDELSNSINEKINSFIQEINRIKSGIENKFIDTMSFGNIDIDFNTGEIIEKYKDKLKEVTKKSNQAIERIRAEDIDALIESEPQRNIPKGFYDDYIDKYKYREPDRNLTTVGLPYQNIANDLGNALYEGLSSIKEKFSDIGKDIKPTIGGIEQNTLENLFKNLTSNQTFGLSESLQNFSNYIYKTGNIIDNLINLSFSREKVSQVKEQIPTDTYNTIIESISRTQQEMINKSTSNITNFLNSFINDLGYVRQIKTFYNLPLNVGSPEFYSGIFGHQIEKPISIGVLGTAFNDLIENINNLDKILTRSIYPKQNIERELTQYMKGMGLTFFQSEPFNNIINTLKQSQPEIYSQFKPTFEKIQKISLSEELGQAFTEMRELITSFETNNLTEIDREELKPTIEKINIDKINSLLNEFEKIGNLDDNTKKSVNSIRNFINSLKQFSEGVNVPFENLNVNTFVENIKNLGNNLEKQVNEFFSRDFKNVISDLSNIKNIAPSIQELPKENLTQFSTVIDTFSNTLQKIEHTKGNIGFIDRLSYGFRSNFHAPLKELIELNIQNFQWALMLGMSTSIMDILSRPAYETVYSTVSPIYQSIGNLTGLTPFFNIFQQFPQEITQMTSLLQTSLNSISALLGSRFYSQEAIRTATQIAKVQPIQIPEALELLTAISTYPSTRPYAESKEFQTKMFDITQLLSLLAPEQGIQGALFAIREALGGQWRSMQLRFNVSPEVLAQYAGIGEEKLRGATGKELIDYLYTSLTRMFGGEQVLLQKGAQLDIQLGNILDTLITNLILPLTSQQTRETEALVSKWFESGILEQFMPQQYKMIEQIAKERVGEGASPASLRAEMLSIAQQTWGTPTGNISGILSLFNTAFGDILSGFRLSDAIGNIISEFGNNFTNALEKYSKSIENLDVFSEKYPQQRKEIGIEFINDILNTLSQSIQNVTGSNLSIGPILNTVREAIVGEASQITSFILKETILTAGQLPGTLMGLGAQGTSEFLTSGTISSFSDMIRDFGSGISGFLSWINLIKMKEVSMSPEGGLLRAFQTAGMSLMGTATSGYLLQQHDILSNLLALPLLYLSTTEKLSATGKFGMLTPLMVGGISIADTLKHNLTGIGSYISSAIESALTFGLLGSSFGPITGIIGAIAGAGLGIGLNYFQNKQSQEDLTNKFTDFIDRQLTAIDSLSTTISRRYETTFYSAMGKDYVTSNREQFRQIEQYVTRLYQMPHLMSLESTKMFENVFKNIEGINPERISQVIQPLYNKLTSVFTDLTTKTREGKEIDTSDIRTSIIESFRQVVGKTTFEKYQPQFESIANTLTPILSQQLQFTSQLSNSITSVFRQLQPAIAYKTVEDIFYQKPIRIEDIKSAEDIPRFTTNIQRALGNMVNSFKEIPSLSKLGFEFLNMGQLPYTEYKSYIDTLLKPFEMLRHVTDTTSFADKIAKTPLFSSYIELYKMSSSGLLPPQYRDIFNRETLSAILSKKAELVTEQIEPGIKVLGMAQQQPLDLSSLQQIQPLTQQIDVSGVSNSIINAGNQIVSALSSVATKIRSVNILDMLPTPTQNLQSNTLNAEMPNIPQIQIPIKPDIDIGKINTPPAPQPQVTSPAQSLDFGIKEIPIPQIKVPTIPDTGINTKDLPTPPQLKIDIPTPPQSEGITPKIDIPIPAIKEQSSDERPQHLIVGSLTITTGSVTING